LRSALMNHPRSARRIPEFVRAFNIDLSEVEVPPGGFSTFNQFFTRALRPGARPIAAPEDDGVLVSPADCRLVVFPTVDAATAIWVKGEGFTLEALLGPQGANLAPLFVDGSFAVARLAPQD
jgi:phosphatidylserine decarboxylase